MAKVSILFVCMGNICRSPTAESVFRSQVEAAGWRDRVHVDSAGTHDYHIGDQPDRRAQQVGAQRGYDLSRLRGRQVCQSDFIEFDHVLAMDNANLAILQRLCPDEHAGKLALFMNYASNCNEREVPDPYYGGAQGFERVLDMIEDAGRGLLWEIQKDNGRED